MEQQLDESRIIFRLFRLTLRIDGMEFGIFLRIHLLDFQEGVKHADDEDRSTAPKAPDHGRRNLSLRGDVGDANPSEEDREKIPNEAPSVA